MIAEFLFLYGIGNKFSFLIIGHGPHQFYFFTACIFRPKDFWDLSFIIFYNLIGNIQYALCAAVILFQLYHFYIIIIFLKL